MPELTAKQRRFAMEYLVDLNATQAAIRAGYSPNGASVTGCRLLADPKIQAVVQKHNRKREERTEITADRVLKEMARLAFADIGQAFDENGGLLPIHKMPEDVRRAVASVETDELADGSGAERAVVGQTRKVKTWDKPRVLEMLAKHLGLFEEAARGESSGPAEGPIVIRRRGPDGAVVEETVAGPTHHHRPDEPDADADAVGVSPGLDDED
jgi:phage terminase small subunit